MRRMSVSASERHLASDPLDYLLSTTTMTPNHSRFETLVMLAPIALFALGGALLPRLAVGQIATLSGGTHVHIALRQAGDLVDGSVFSQSADSIGVASDGKTRMIPLSSIAGIQVGNGRSHSRGGVRGLEIGTMIGGGVSLLFVGSYASYDGQKRQEDLYAAIFASLFTGAFYGGIIGAAVGSESWATVYPARVALTPWRAPNGARGLGLSLNF
jgi:hypothetical protein